MRRNDVASTSFRRRVPTRFLINQCQIITFLILKYDIIENSRIELRGIVLPVQVCGLLGGQRVCCPPPSQIIGGGCPPPPAPPPLPTPMGCHDFSIVHLIIRHLNFQSNCPTLDKTLFLAVTLRRFTLPHCVTY